MINEIETVKIGDLAPGDLVDMSLILEKLITEYGAEIDYGDRMMAECEVATVYGIEPETADCVVIHTDEHGSYGVHPNWLIDKCGRAENYC